MISVLVRSIGRSTLGRALDSIALQREDDLIVVLVDAKGDLYESIPCQPEHLNVPFRQTLLEASNGRGRPLRFAFTKPQKNGEVLPRISPLPHGLREDRLLAPVWPDFKVYPFNVLLVSAGTLLGRSEAADLALKIGASLSELSVFLDDDDTFMDGHLSALEAALVLNKDAVVAHTSALLSAEPACPSAGKPDSAVYGHELSSVEVETHGADHPIGRRFEPWELLYANHIPIHCALFKTDLIRRYNLSFDAQLEVYEDWDFWLQLQSLGSFVWVEGCTARYYVSEDVRRSSKVHGLERHEEAYQKIWQKWKHKAPSQWWFELLARTGPNLNRLEALDQSVKHFADLKAALEVQLRHQQHSVSVQADALEELKLALATQLEQNRNLHDQLANAKKLWGELKKVELELRQRVDHSTQREEALRTEVSKAYDAAQSWRQRGESLASQSSQLQRQLQAVFHSRSWRVTRPLRYLGSIARRMGLAELYRRLRVRGKQANLVLTRLRTQKRDRQPIVAKAAHAHDTGSELQQDQERLSTRFEQTSNLLDPYQHWIISHESRHLRGMTNALTESDDTKERLVTAPLISIVMPMFNAPLVFFKEAIESVKMQSDPRWELCIADDASTDQESLLWLKQELLRDPRIKLIERSKNGHIVACSNSALALASADWIALMDQDDLLSPFAVAEVLRAIKMFPAGMLFYSDEDKINSEGHRSDPYFKPAFNLELLRAQNTFSHLGVFSRSLVNSVGGFQAGTEGSQDHDLVLRCIEKISADQVIHIPKVLYHWRIHDQSTASDIDVKPYALINGLKAVNEHLKRTVSGAEAISHESISHYVVRYPLPLVLPRVEIIIPTRNGFDVLSRCLETLFELTHYPKLLVTVVDNGSDDSRVIGLLEKYKNESRINLHRYEGEFNFSAINNFAVEKSDAEYILFLNNDIEIMRSDWLDEMLRQACRSEVGAVGAMLWYPEMKMQHAGVVIGAGGVAGHAHHKLPAGHPGYFGRAALALEVSAVTAACLLMRRTVFEEAGGFDEVSLAVAFNDVDLCLKVRGLGYKVIFTPRAELIHNESATRGNDLAPEHRDRFERECAVMRRRWSAVINNDPSYNPNLELMTSTYQAYAEPRDHSARSALLPRTEGSG